MNWGRGGVWVWVCRWMFGGRGSFVVRVCSCLRRNDGEGGRNEGKGRGMRGRDAGMGGRRAGMTGRGAGMADVEWVIGARRDLWCWFVAFHPPPNLPPGRGEG